MSLVIDSNIWISALVFGGNPRKIFELTVKNGWRITASEEIFTEVRRILHQKFPDFLSDFEDLVTALQPNIVMVKLGSQPVAASRDKNDDMILETALIGSADAVVTGDKDLLVLVNYEDTSILTPIQFLDAHG